MPKTTIYHNPRCSKSRQTLELLDTHGIEVNIIEYLKTPPGIEQLEEILKLLNMQPRELMRTSESAYKDNALDDPGLSREQLIQAMVDHPGLIQRPIVLNKGKA
ncbi:MAG TPA: arsenate reductase (glutaredoxin), partial [Gammaproteobacteria bacterium]|nr:arsenate reductase (glutaredoxin) [Gammaproteobacteria bacterium]